MVVDGEVRQPAVSRAENSSLNELGLEHAVTAVPGYVVDAVRGKVEFARD